MRKWLAVAILLVILASAAPYFEISITTEASGTYVLKHVDDVYESATTDWLGPSFTNGTIKVGAEILITGTAAGKQIFVKLVPFTSTTYANIMARIEGSVFKLYHRFGSSGLTLDYSGVIVERNAWYYIELIINVESNLSTTFQARLYRYNDTISQWELIDDTGEHTGTLPEVTSVNIRLGWGSSAGSYPDEPWYWDDIYVEINGVVELFEDLEDGNLDNFVVNAGSFTVVDAVTEGIPSPPPPVNTPTSTTTTTTTTATTTTTTTTVTTTTTTTTTSTTTTTTTTTIPPPSAVCSETPIGSETFRCSMNLINTWESLSEPPEADNAILHVDASYAAMITANHFRLKYFLDWPTNNESVEIRFYVGTAEFWGAVPMWGFILPDMWWSHTPFLLTDQDVDNSPETWRGYFTITYKFSIRTLGIVLGSDDNDTRISIFAGNEWVEVEPGLWQAGNIYVYIVSESGTSTASTTLTLANVTATTPVDNPLELDITTVAGEYIKIYIMQDLTYKDYLEAGVYGFANMDQSITELDATSGFKITLYDDIHNITTIFYYRFEALGELVDAYFAHLDWNSGYVLGGTSYPAGNPGGLYVYVNNQWAHLVGGWFGTSLKEWFSLHNYGAVYTLGRNIIYLPNAPAQISSGTYVANGLTKKITFLWNSNSRVWGVAVEKEFWDFWGTHLADAYLTYSVDFDTALGAWTYYITALADFLTYQATGNTVSLEVVADMVHWTRDETHEDINITGYYWNTENMEWVYVDPPETSWVYHASNGMTALVQMSSNSQPTHKWEAITVKFLASGVSAEVVAAHYNSFAAMFVGSSSSNFNVVAGSVISAAGIYYVPPLNEPAYFITPTNLTSEGFTKAPSSPTFYDWNNTPDDVIVFDGANYYFASPSSPPPTTTTPTTTTQPENGGVSYSLPWVIWMMLPLAIFIVAVIAWGVGGAALSLPITTLLAASGVVPAWLSSLQATAIIMLMIYMYMRGAGNG